MKMVLAAMAMMVSAPIPPSPPASGIPVPVGGCHADVRDHYVPEFGRAMPHRHRRDCSPVAAEAPRQAPRQAIDCHREAREHYVPGHGRILHRHVGPDCAIRVIRRSSSKNPD